MNHMPEHLHRGAIKKKMFQIVGKVHNFLDPPPPYDHLDFFEFEKKLIFDDPPPLD